MIFILILNCVTLCTKQCQASLKDNDFLKYTPSRSLNVLNVLIFFIPFDMCLCVYIGFSILVSVLGG